MKLRKLLALIMALMMAVCVFAACGEEAVDNNDDEKVEEKADEKAEEPEKEVSDEDAVEAAMNEFADLYFAGDEKALDYVSKDVEGYEDIKNGIEEIKSMKAKFDDLAEDFGMPDEYNKKIETLANKFADDVFGKMKITVNDVDVNGDEAVAKCIVETPMLDEMDSLMSEELLSEAILSTFTEEEIEALNNADETEQIEASLKIIEVLFDLMAENIEVMSEDVEYSLNKVDGKWIIAGKN